MLASKTVTELLEAFASPTPTPGGGSAAALSGAVAASLLGLFLTSAQLLRKSDIAAARRPPTAGASQNTPCR